MLLHAHSLACQQCIAFHYTMVKILRLKSVISAIVFQSNHALEHIVTVYQRVTDTATVRGGMDSEERLLTAQIAADLNDLLFPQASQISTLT